MGCNYPASSCERREKEEEGGRERDGVWSPFCIANSRGREEGLGSPPNSRGAFRFFTVGLFNFLEISQTKRRRGGEGLLRMDR